MSWINSVLQVIQLVPSILQLIVQIEQIFKPIQTSDPTTKFGATKKQLIVDSLSVAGANQKVTETVSNVIDKSVTTLNTVGFSAKN